MNKLSRLTALLLALMMILSTFAAAETAYPVGGMTMEQWGQLVNQAQGELYTIDEGDAGKTITPESPEQAERGDYYPYADGVTLALADEAVSCQISASGVAVLTNASAGQWQMKIGSSWVNISGETGASLSVTGAMMNGMTSAEVRKALAPKDGTTGEYAAYTAAATVEIVEKAPALFSAKRADASTEDSTGEDAGLPYSLQRANEGATMYTVVVEYKFENGTTAAGSWGASVGAGTNLNEIVPNPNVVGYKPKTTVVVNPANVAGITYTPATVATADDAANNVKIGDVTDPGSVNLAITGIDQHITVTVTYEPTLVDYTVIHKQQNTDNDNYTEVERVTERGLTGSIVPDKDIARSYPGFYSLLYEQPTIAANGSTIVEISYDRYYYLISFELSGGYGVDPVYGRFGSPVSIPEPERAGYAFDGWDKPIPTEIPAEHMVIKAKWKPTTADYTVVYWFENADSTDSKLKANYSAVHVVTVPNAATESTVTSDSRPDITSFGNGVVNGLNEHPKHFTRYTNTDAVANCDLEGTYTVAGDGSTIVNVYYTRKEYTIRFYYMRSRTDGTGYQVPSDYGRYLENAAWNHSEHADYPRVKAQYAHMAGYQDITFNKQTHRYYYLELTAKYNSDLSAIWPNLPLEYDNGSDYHGRTQNSWAIHGDAPYYNMVGNTKTFKGVYTRLDDALIPASTNDDILDIPNGFVTYFVSYWGQRQQHFLYNIYFETIPGDTLPAGAVTKRYDKNNKTYVLVAQNEALSGSGYNGQNAPAYEGAKNIAKDDPEKGNGSTNNPIHVDFFYERLKYDLIFMSNGEQVRKDEVPFGAQMEKYQNTLSAEYAPNSYSYFDGWYTAETCVPETRFEFTGSTMPANNVTLYAKWTPNTYKVRFFLTEDIMKTGLDENAYSPTMADGKQAIFEDVPHGTQIDQEFVDNYLDYNAMTVNGGVFYPYTFVAWFYYDDNGVKHPFEPKTQIKQNLDVFAEWSSDVLVPYTIKYAVPKIENGNRVVDYYVADDTTGSALAGVSKTFEAKGGAELWANYQTGCFPETESNTIKFTEEQAQTGVEYIFWYTDEVKVPYKVYYVTKTQDADNSLKKVEINGVAYYQLLNPKSVDDNENAIVTETFETVSGYMPDAYQKRLIVTQDGNPNNDVIIFIYTKDEQHAYYRVTHYIENLEADASGNMTWTEYASSQFVGDIGVTKEYNDDQLTISGFEFSHETYAVGNTVKAGSPDNVATLTEDGMQINLYYTRKEYPYKVQYLLENTTNELAPEKNGAAKYEKTVTENALTIDNYELVSAGSQNLTIRIEEDLTKPKLNIITFYYREKTVTINYEAVGPENAQNFGSVNPEQEQLAILSGVATGSVATAGENYTFVGWYSDQACTTLLTNADRYVPTKATDAVWADGTTYYAKFEEKQVTLHYAVVTGCEQMGFVSPEEEQVKVLTGEAQGSTATAGAYYEFVGWYDTQDGSGNAISTSATFVPTKDADAAWQDGTTWYAKFQEKEATINYVVVGPTGCGTVAPESETIDMVTGVPAGSAAEAGEHYHFVGWYSDAECNVPVDSAWVENDKITPVKADGTAWPDTTTYYAKFEEDEVAITYVAALRDGQTVTVANGTGGLVDLNDGESNAAIETSETVKVSSAAAAGATAVKNESYKFIGWYSDAACETLVSNDAAYAPGKINGLNVAATYYALFEIDVADLVITKTVDGKENPPTAPFELTISLPDGLYSYTATLGAVSSEGTLTVADGKGMLTIRDGEVITIHDVVIGSAFAVEEEDLPWFVESITASGAEISADGNLVTITNTYQTGSLSVTKRVDVQAGVAAPPADLEFEIEVLLENAPLGDSVSVSIGNAARQPVALNDGKLTFKLMHGQTATIYDLPVGTDYQVTEVNVPDNFVVTYDNHAAGKIVDGSIETIVINNYPERYAELTVTKAGLQASNESAVVDVVITTNNVSVTYTLVLNQSNSSATITHIPVGSNYTVTERDAWTWQYKDTTAQSGTIVDGGSTVQMTNTAESDKWLHDESYLVNNINTGGSSGVNN